MWQEHVQRPVETLFVDLRRGNAQQIGQGTLGIKLLAMYNSLEGGRDGKGPAPEPSATRESLPLPGASPRGRIPSGPLLDSCSPNHGPPKSRRCSTRTRLTSTSTHDGGRRRRIAFAGPAFAFRRSLHALAIRFVELPEIGNDALPRSLLGAIRFHQHPVGMALAVLAAIARANEHARILCSPRCRSKAKSSLQRLGSSRRSKRPPRQRAYERKPPFHCDRQLRQDFCRIINRWRTWVRHRSLFGELTASPAEPTVCRRRLQTQRLGIVVRRNGSGTQARNCF